MKKLLMLLVALLPLVASAQKKDKDWADYGRYEKANAMLTKAPTVVFMGNSITQCWYEMHPDFFDNNNFAGRGISGQVTQQMMSRFRGRCKNDAPGCRRVDHAAAEGDCQDLQDVQSAWQVPGDDAAQELSERA